MDDLTDKLFHYFGHRKFKSELQERAVRAIARGVHDVFVSMPTGSGKSLCFQLPAMLADNKLAIVFSPLLALIKDQIDHLMKIKIPAESINSKMTKTDRERVLNDLHSMKPNTRFLYVTPEQAATGTFKSLMEHLIKFKKVSYVIVDEAHCVSEWGHDFRPDYLKLGDLREQYKAVPWVALTATASIDVAKDILVNLKLLQPVAQYKTPSFRKNLYYDVIFQNTIQDEIGHLMEFLEKSLKEDVNFKQKDKNAVIVYCRTRDQTEELASMLTKRGLNSLAYHGGLKAPERISVQEQWTAGECPCVCATVSFGMGVDKASVRAVAHWGLAQNVAAYYQESGRAGRDGKPAFCRIYYCRNERNAVDFLLKKELAMARDEQKQRVKNSYKSFEIMVKYCEDVKCRHKTFAEYFGEEMPKCMGRCDACADERGVRRALEQHMRRAMSARLERAGFISNEDPSGLYGEGRYGQKREAEAYNKDDSDESDGESTRKRVAEETRTLIQKEFANRKSNKADKQRQKNDEDSAKYSKCKAAESTGKKVNGLTIPSRESYLSLLKDALNKNLASLRGVDDPENPLTKHDVEKCAIEMEYEAFSKSTVVSLYRRALTKMISSVKACTNKLHPELKCFEPRKRNTLGEFVKEFESQKQQEKNRNQYGFVTAAELERGVTDGKNEERVLSKADKETKRKANSFKKHPFIQTKLKSFFKKASHLSLSSTPDQSEDDRSVLDENNTIHYNYTTSNLEDIRDNNHNNTTLKIEDSDESDNEEQRRRKTFVINITLQGVPNKNKLKTDSIEAEDAKMKEIHHTKGSSSASPLRIKTIAKRKIKDLFGESSGSDLDQEEDSRVKKESPGKKVKSHHSHKRRNTESHESKRFKQEPKVSKDVNIDKNKSESRKSEKRKEESNSRTHHHKHRKHDKSLDKQSHKEKESNSEVKLNEKNGVKLNEKNNVKLNDKKNCITDDLLGILSESDSEKELVIDDGTDPSAPVMDEDKRKDLNILVDTDILAPFDMDTENEVNNSVSIPDPVLDKAHKLSIEADKVLQELKQFSEMPPVPILPSNIKESMAEDDVRSPDIPICKHSKSRHRHDKDQPQSKKERHHKIDNSKSERRKRKLEAIEKKSGKLDVAGMVVKLLMPYYKKKKINSRELFKITARHIVHQLLAIQVTEEAAIDMLLKKAFSQEIKIETESDLVVKLNLSNNI